MNTETNLEDIFYKICEDAISEAQKQPALLSPELWAILERLGQEYDIECTNCLKPVWWALNERYTYNGGTIRYINLLSGKAAIDYLKKMIPDESRIVKESEKFADYLREIRDDEAWIQEESEKPISEFVVKVEQPFDELFRTLTKDNCNTFCLWAALRQYT